jgi:hypothetical protein
VPAFLINLTINVGKVRRAKYVSSNAGGGFQNKCWDSKNASVCGLSGMYPMNHNSSVDPIWFPRRILEFWSDVELEFNSVIYRKRTYNKES